jgi:scyllo-inositol 2-dehydrogenase (NADP+)
MSRPLRVAVLGFGMAGEGLHAAQVAATPGLRVTVVVTRDPVRAARARRLHPGVEVLAGADEVWARAREVDLVVVATPNRSHVPLGLAAVAAGLPVVVDKPLAATAPEAARLVDAADAAGVPLTVFQNRRWDGDFLLVAQVLEEGTLGAVQRFEGRFDVPLRPARGWRAVADPAEGPGVLLDLGAHLVDQAVLLLGPPARVYAELAARAPGAVADDDAFLALTRPDGTVAHLWLSRSTSAPGPRFRVVGLDATLTVDAPEDKDDPRRLAPARLAGRLGGLSVDAAVRPRPAEHDRFYAGVRDALLEGRPMPVDPRDAVRTALVLDAARAAAATGTVVALDEVQPRTGTAGAG